MDLERHAEELRQQAAATADWDVRAQAVLERLAVDFARIRTAAGVTPLSVGFVTTVSKKFSKRAVWVERTRAWPVGKQKLPHMGLERLVAVTVDGRAVKHGGQAVRGGWGVGDAKGAPDVVLLTYRGGAGDGGQRVRVPHGGTP